MQIDIHYYATYCLARAAGINKTGATRIAYAAQYVDDCNNRETDTHYSGSRLISVPTAHHTTSIKNIDRNDQRYIWVPFHFIPGGEGDSFTGKLVCQKDSEISNEMFKNHINEDKTYLLELVGIGAHVYFDTFAHYGFSGVSSRRNRVDGTTLKIEQSNKMVEQTFGAKVAKWFEKHGEQGGLLDNIRSTISAGAELATGALGHGGVSVYPDQPYLKWSFEYEYPDMTGNKKSIRDNSETYLEGCKKIYKHFQNFVELNPEYNDSSSFIEFEDIEDKIKEILTVESDKEDRSQAWIDAAKDGLYNIEDDIPLYDDNDLHNEFEEFSNLTNAEDIVNMKSYNFYQAASYHVHYVLRELLPKHKIIVI